MATVYPTAAGTWSTRTWNDDSTGAAYGPGTPQTGDTVLANGLAITLNVDITVASLRTTAGSTAVAGGSFSTSGAIEVTADTYAGTTSCLSVNSRGVHIGNSYGSGTTAGSGTVLLANGIHYGNSYGGSASNRHGTTVVAGSFQVGNSYGGTGANAHGTSLASGGIQYGNAYGSNTHAAYGTRSTGGILFGDSYGGSVTNSVGVYFVTSPGVQVGNSYGGSGSGSYGTHMSGSSTFIGSGNGGSGGSAYGVYADTYSLIVTGEVVDGGGLNAFGVRTYQAYVLFFNGVVIGDISDAGSTTELSTTDIIAIRTKPFWSPVYEVAGGSTLPLIGRGGLVY